MYVFPVPPKIAGDPSEKFIARENETVVLPCLVNGVPPPKVTWRKNFVPFEPDDDRYLFGDHGLTISDVKIGDKAIYECVAENNAGTETKILVLVVQGNKITIYPSDNYILNNYVALAVDS